MVRDRKRVVAILLAGGDGTRMNGIDKMMAYLGGKPLLTHSLEVLDACDEVDAIRLVVSELHEEDLTALGSATVKSTDLRVCVGGAVRSQSTLNGLRADARSGFEWALVHDGARPFLNKEILGRGLASTARFDAAIAAIPASDTIKIADDLGMVAETPPRRSVWMAQTPQIARFASLLDAHERLEERLHEFTDEASVLEQCGYPVSLYEGSQSNVKITTPEDLVRAESIIDALRVPSGP